MCGLEDFRVYKETFGNNENTILLWDSGMVKTRSWIIDTGIGWALLCYFVGTGFAFLAISSERRPVSNTTDK